MQALKAHMTNKNKQFLPNTQHFLYFPLVMQSCWVATGPVIHVMDLLPDRLGG